MSKHRSHPEISPPRGEQPDPSSTAPTPPRGDLDDSQSASEWWGQGSPNRPASGGTRVLEVTELWFNHVMNVRQFGPEVPSVFASARSTSSLPPIAASVVTALMLSAVGFFAVRHARTEVGWSPDPQDLAIMASWQATPGPIGDRPTEEAESTADPLSVAGEAWRAAWEREARRRRLDRPTPAYDPQVSPDGSALLRTELLPWARLHVGTLDRRWTDVLRTIPPRIEVLEDAGEPRPAEDLATGTRVRWEGKTWMVQAPMIRGEGRLARQGGTTAVIEGSSPLQLDVPTAELQEDQGALWRESREILWTHHLARSNRRGICEVADDLALLPDAGGRLDVTSWHARCLAEAGRWEESKPFVERGLRLVAALTEAAPPIPDIVLVGELKALDGELALRAAFQGDWRTASPMQTEEGRRTDASQRLDGWREFVLRTSHNPAALGVIHEAMGRLHRQEGDEKAAAAVRAALLSCGVGLLFLPLAVGLDVVRRRGAAQDFFVPEGWLPGGRFALAEQLGAFVSVRFTRDAVGWLERCGSRTPTGDLIQRGLAREKEGVWSIDLGEDDRFVHHIGDLAFTIQQVVAAPPAASPRRFEEGRFLGALLFLLALGVLFGARVLLGPADPTQEAIVPPVRSLVVEIQDRPPEEAEGRRSLEPAGAQAKAGRAGRPESRLVATRGGVAANRHMLDRSIAQNSGLLAELANLSSTVFDGGGLGEAVTAGIGGLLGSEGTQQGGGNHGSRGSGWGDGGSAEGIDGVGVADRGRGGGPGGKSRLGAPRSNGPAAEPGDPILVGRADKAAIDRVVKSHLASIRYCYERELTLNPRLGGKVSVKFVIARDGSVSQAGLKSTTMNNPVVEDCVVQRFLRMRFPAPDSGGIVLVSYPFIFST